MKTLSKVYGLSDKGIFRQANEDFYGYYISSYGTLLIVSDGMGGTEEELLLQGLLLNL